MGCARFSPMSTPKPAHVTCSTIRDEKKIEQLRVGITKLTPGMDREDVFKLLGKPNRTDVLPKWKVGEGYLLDYYIVKQCKDDAGLESDYFVMFHFKYSKLVGVYTNVKEINLKNGSVPVEE